MEIMLYYDLQHSVKHRDCILKRGIYKRRLVGVEDDGIGSDGLWISYASSRIWEETDEGISYRKHRLDPKSEIDLKEFAWVKLSAKEII